MPKLLTAQEAGLKLGISARRIRALAVSRGVGHRIGPAWVFNSKDMKAMRVRTNGRPPMKQEEPQS